MGSHTHSDGWPRVRAPFHSTKYHWVIIWNMKAQVQTLSLTTHFCLFSTYTEVGSEPYHWQKYLILCLGLVISNRLILHTYSNCLLKCAFLTMLKAKFIISRNSSSRHRNKHYADLNKKDWRDTTSLQLVWQYLLCSAVITEISKLLWKFINTVHFNCRPAEKKLQLCSDGVKI